MSDIEKRNDNVIASDEENPSSETTKLIVSSSLWSGPLPPPEVFEGYKQIQADFPERILKMAEREQKYNHRHIYIGQFSALIIGLVLIVGGFLLIMAGHKLIGIAPIVLAIGSLVSIYFAEIRQKHNTHIDNNND